MRGLTVDALNPAILNVQYAVRGELAIKAEEYRVQLKTNVAHDLPFNKVISSNIGNPQQIGLDQPPITFNRQVRADLFGARCTGLARLADLNIGSGVDGMASSR
jgi:alanine transaminase